MSILGADLPSDDSDSDFEERMSELSEGDIEIETSEKRVIDQMSSSIRGAKLDRIFDETKKTALLAAIPSEKFVIGGDELWSLFNNKAPKRVKNTSLDHLMFQLNQISNSSESPQPDFRTYKRREPSGSVSVSSLLARVDSQFVEISEEVVFAGNKMVMKRKIPAASAEAIRFMKQQAVKASAPEPDQLDSYLGSFVYAKKARLVNSMDKSSADWNRFKDDKNLQDSLELERKKGFLDKRGFLSKVDAEIAEKVREAKRPRL
jgi:hypothetical protein